MFLGFRTDCTSEWIYCLEWMVQCKKKTIGKGLIKWQQQPTMISVTLLRKLQADFAWKQFKELLTLIFQNQKLQTPALVHSCISTFQKPHARLWLGVWWNHGCMWRDHLRKYCWCIERGEECLRVSQRKHFCVFQEVVSWLPLQWSNFFTFWDPVTLRHCLVCGGRSRIFVRYWGFVNKKFRLQLMFFIWLPNVVTQIKNLIAHPPGIKRQNTFTPVDNYKNIWGKYLESFVIFRLTHNTQIAAPEQRVHERQTAGNNTLGNKVPCFSKWVYGRIYSLLP